MIALRPAFNRMPLAWKKWAACRPRLVGAAGRRQMCAKTVEAAEGTAGRPSTGTLVRHFVTCAVPMVGFGIMDNTILIRAGDAIDNSLGDTFNLTGLECAACGQVFSDFCGVVFGGVIESISRKFILPPSLSASQHAMRVTQLVGTTGAAVGVVCGCVLGMGNLLLMDLKEAERQKLMEEMKGLFMRVLKSSMKAFGAEFGSIFVVDDDKQELWTFGATGIDTVIRVPISEKSLVGWTAVNKKALNIKDAYKDDRFNPETDKSTGRRTTSVLSIPIFSQHNDDKVIAVLQLINKQGGFDGVDMKMAVMVGEHTSIFLTELLDKKV